ncbi:hypothetical protein SCHPADRAFT_923602 [Schizopora paradoxa]|uniref:Glutathione S-transferase n=1 Tax=Schizopora paradoxa TaxID=27342 RepID=A0A0H2S8A1_9AGAM|nr:hypothetical protein SCHPADRAFT_923602 [Schizopora paradoxa]
MNASKTFTLFHAPGSGSTFSLALLQALNVPHEVVSLNFEARDEDSPEASRLKQTNPLCQFPTLVSPEGAVMTEMGGIALYLHDQFAANTPWSKRDLTAEQLALFYRLMFFIPGNIYPTIAAIDFPERFIVIPSSADLHVTMEAAVGWVMEKGLENREAMYKVLEGIIAAESTRRGGERKYCLGTEHPTIPDVYITLMAHYSPRPRFGWLKEHCPTIWTVADNTMKDPVIRSVFWESFTSKDSPNDDAWPQ